MLSGNFAEMTTSTPFRDLLHAANLRHGPTAFTSPPKEGVLRIFSPLKIQRLRPGLNPRTWLSLDHRSRMYIYVYVCLYIYIYGSMFCMFLLNFVNYVLLLLHICVLLLRMFRSVYSVSLCRSVYCLCVNVYCTTATG